MSAGDRQADEHSRLTWGCDDDFSVDGVEYVCRPLLDTFDSTHERFCIRKSRAEVERLEQLLRRCAPRTIFEVGIHKGGSTALLAQLARPEKLVGVDIGPPEDGVGLADFFKSHGLEARASIHWGVDQADRDRLGAIAAAELGQRPLDLVIDDASHFLEPTRETFNALFPRLRPGGTYLLEDWGWAHAALNLRPDLTPLSVLVFEALVAAAHAPEAIAEIKIDRWWAIITRGPASLEPGSFDLRRLLGPTGEELLAHLPSSHGRETTAVVTAAPPPPRVGERLGATSRPGRARAAEIRAFRKMVRARHPRFTTAVAADVRLVCAGRGRRLKGPSRARLLIEALRLAWETDAFLGQVMYRAKARLQGVGVPILPRLLHRMAISSGGVCIGDPVVVHPGLDLVHGQVVIDGIVEIHSGVSVFPFATIGLIAGSRAGPTVRAGAKIGSGAKVLGEVEVGEGARVGANSVVIQDVPAGATAVGVPARIARQPTVPPS